ncbi:hypothetical protein ACTA71_002425 [Dictyostelium dimigraforme]
MNSYQLVKNENGNRKFKLELVKNEIPQPKENEILIQVRAVSLNFRDNMVIRGDDPFGEKALGLTPVSDVVGIVVKIGNKVNRDDIKINDRVTCNFCTDWIDGKAKSNYENTLGFPINGGLAEYMILPADAVVIPPSYLSDEEVTTLPIAALTAYHSLVVKGNLSKDQFVLIQGTGGVSIFALQIVHAIGAKSIVLTSSNEKSEKVKSLGANFVINYKETPNWSEKVLEITNGVGVDQILEVVGGDNISKSIDVSRRESNIFIVGALESTKTNLDIIKILAKRINIIGILVGPKKSFDEMNQFFSKHLITPIIEKVYQFNQAEIAYQHLESGAFGKIVIKI